MQDCPSHSIACRWRRSASSPSSTNARERASVPFAQAVPHVTVRADRVRRNHPRLDHGQLVLTGRKPAPSSSPAQLSAAASISSSEVVSGFYGWRSVLAGSYPLALGLKLGSSCRNAVLVGDQMPACSSTVSRASDPPAYLQLAQEGEHLIAIASCLFG